MEVLGIVTSPEYELRHRYLTERYAILNGQYLRLVKVAFGTVSQAEIEAAELTVLEARLNLELLELEKP